MTTYQKTMHTEDAPNLLSEPNVAMPLPGIGNIVGFVLSNGTNKGDIRPAIIVRLWGTPTKDYTPACQLQVFTDGTNDHLVTAQSGASGLFWATSVPYNAEKRPGTWHYLDSQQT